MVKINPSLMFSGACGEAFRRYASLFGGEIVLHADVCRVAARAGSARQTGATRCGSRGCVPEDSI